MCTFSLIYMTLIMKPYMGEPHGICAKRDLVVYICLFSLWSVWMCVIVWYQIFYNLRVVAMH